MRKLLINTSFLICCFLCQVITYGQDTTLTLSGTVMDEEGKELAGTSIKIVFGGNKKTDAIADADGRFRLQNIPSGATIIFSSIGYDAFEMVVTESKDKMKIALKRKVKEDDEVVIVGHGKQRKITMTGAVTTVDAKDLQIPASSVSNMLGGRVPGIISVTRSGEPGSDFSEFWVRGISTFGASSSALILIDGVEGDLNNLDPSDIETFSILKDASATAVYGVRGANGVVLVTTKRGKAGALQVNFKINSTLTQSARMPAYADAYEYAKLANEARVVRGYDPVYSDVELELFKTGLDPDLYPNVNWRDVILKKSSRYDQYNLNISGGGTNARYYMSLGFLNKQGIFEQDKSVETANVNTNYKKYTFRANIDVDLTKTTKLALNMDDAIVMQTSPAYSTSSTYLWEAQADVTPVSVPVRYSNGLLAGYGTSGTDLTPYYLLNYTGFRKLNANTINAKLSLDQDLKFVTPGLTARGLFSWTYYGTNTATHSKYGAPVYRATGRANDGSLITTQTVWTSDAGYSQSSGVTRSMYMEAQLNYNRRFGKDHNVTGLVHVYRQENITSDVDAYEEDYMSIIPVRYQALSGRATYSFRDIYLLEANVGYSGSETFKPGEQYGLFPALSAGWVPTQYEWTQKHLPFLNHFKIRASWGKVGNSQIYNSDGDLVRFPYQTVLTTSSNDWGTTLSESKIGVDDLKWQTSTKYDLGIDMKLFNSKLDIVFDIFRTDAEDIYQQRVTIPEEVGAAQSPYINAGSMRSWGADGTIAWNQKLAKDLSMTLRSNFTFSRNKVTHWEQTGISYPYQSYTGVPYGVQRGLIALGLFKDENDIASSPTQTFMTSYLPGDIKYKDVNGDGIIDTDDVVPLDYSNVPRIVYGFATSFTWKNWTANIFFTGQDQVSYFLGGTGYYPFSDGSTGNILSIVADQNNRWTPESYSGTTDTENPNARFPRLTYGSNDNNNRSSTFWLADASFLRLKNVEIAYKIEGKWLNRLHMKSATISVVGDNLAVWDKVKLWDPEQASSNGAAYPLQRMYTAQLYINF
ncbi:MAG: TonB-dependent receptor [Niabella sp.]